MKSRFAKKAIPINLIKCQHYDTYLHRITTICVKDLGLSFFAFHQTSTALCNASVL